MKVHLKIDPWTVNSQLSVSLFGFKCLTFTSPNTHQQGYMVTMGSLDYMCSCNRFPINVFLMCFLVIILFLTTKEPKHTQNSWSIVHQSNNLKRAATVGILRCCRYVCVRVFFCLRALVCSVYTVLTQHLVAFVRRIRFKRYNSMHEYLTPYAITWSTCQLEFTEQ